MITAGVLEWWGRVWSVVSSQTSMVHHHHQLLFLPAASPPAISINTTLESYKYINSSGASTLQIVGCVLILDIGGSME